MNGFVNNLFHRSDKDLLTDILPSLREEIVEHETPNIISVHRDDVWGMALIGFGRKRFRPDAPLRVDFFNYGDMAEGAIDEGGPAKELFTLCLQGMMSGPCFIGEPKLLTRDVTGMLYKIYNRSSTYSVTLDRNTI